MTKAQKGTTYFCWLSAYKLKWVTYTIYRGNGIWRQTCNASNYSPPPKWISDLWYQLLFGFWWSSIFKAAAQQYARPRLLRTTDYNLETWIGGTLSAHGLVCSNWAANLNKVASSPNRPANCTPIGTLSLFQCKGTDIAGWPVIFCVRVKTTNDNADLIHFVGSSLVSMKSPSFVGGILMVGLNKTSYLLSWNQRATFLENRWSSSTATK